MLLEIVLNAPITVWAASGEEDDYAIRYWNPGAEETYGYSSSEAIGSNYLDLFVNELERHDAVIDHKHITSTGIVFRGFSAEDRRRDGSPARMFTQAFRIWDDEQGKYLLGEVGVDISEIQKSEGYLSRMREVQLQQHAAAARIDMLNQLNQVLAQIMNAPNDEKGLERVAVALTAAAGGFLGHDTSVRIWYIDRAGKLVPGTDLAPEPFSKEFVESEAVDWTLRTAQPLFFDQESGLTAKQLPFASRSIRTARRRPFALLPLASATDTIGVLVISFGERRRQLTASEEPTAFEFTGELKQRMLAFAGATAFGIAYAGLISDLRRSRRDIAEHRESLARSLIVQDISHEALNIGAAIAGCCQMLEERLGDRVKDDRMIAGYIRKIRAQAKILMPRISEIRNHFAPITFDMNRLLRSMARSVTIKHLKVVAKFDFSTATSPIVAAKRPLEVAIGYVMHNAADAMNGAGTMTIRSNIAGSSASHCEIRIQDTGCGIRREDLEKIWEDSFTTKEGGHGYGLPRARQLIEQCGGSITLEKTELDVGSVFLIVLPVGKSPDKPASSKGQRGG